MLCFAACVGFDFPWFSRCISSGSDIHARDHAALLIVLLLGLLPQDVDLDVQQFQPSERLTYQELGLELGKENMRGFLEALERGLLGPPAMSHHLEPHPAFLRRRGCVRPGVVRSRRELSGWLKMSIAASRSSPVALFSRRQLVLLVTNSGILLFFPS